MAADILLQRRRGSPWAIMENCHANDVRECLSVQTIGRMSGLASVSTEIPFSDTAAVPGAPAEGPMQQEFRRSRPSRV